MRTVVWLNLLVTLTASAESRNWGIAKIGATTTTGIKPVLVAVVDTGVDFTHPRFRGIVASGKDMATNGTQVDVNGHGTHVAGIVVEVAGSSNVEILALKYFSTTNTGKMNLDYATAAINYAVEHRARVINYSGGGPIPSFQEYLALRRAQNAGVLVVVAAGNNGVDSDDPLRRYYPCAYRLSNIICVAATDPDDQLLSTSNYGLHHTDVAAPGLEIVSSAPGGGYASMTGTSQATAFVTGVAAALISRNPRLTPERVKELVVASVDRIQTLQAKVTSGGRVNMNKTLKLLDKNNEVCTKKHSYPTEGGKVH